MLERVDQHDDHRSHAHPRKHLHFLCHFLFHPRSLSFRQLTLVSTQKVHSIFKSLVLIFFGNDITAFSAHGFANLLVIYKFVFTIHRFSLSLRRLGHGHPVGDMISVPHPLRIPKSICVYLLIPNGGIAIRCHQYTLLHILRQPLRHRNPLLHRHAVDNQKNAALSTLISFMLFSSSTSFSRMWLLQFLQIPPVTEDFSVGFNSAIVYLLHDMSDVSPANRGVICHAHKLRPLLVQFFEMATMPNAICEWTGRDAVCYISHCLPPFLRRIHGNSSTLKH